MSNTYTTQDLLSNILLVGHIPVGNNTFTSDQILTLADRELQTRIVPMILATRGGYYLNYTDYAASSSGEYLIPPKATGAMLANVEIVQGPTIIQVNLVQESEQFSTQSPTSTSYSYYIRGNTIKILPLPTVGNVRLYYFIRPSKLIQTTSCAQVVSVSGNLVTVNTAPQNITTGIFVEANDDQPPFETWGGGTITNIASTVYTLDQAISNLSTSDWICPGEQTCIPQIPVEYRPILEQSTVVSMFRIQGNKEKLLGAEKELERMQKDLSRLISPRNQSQTRIISCVNGGFLGSNTNRWTNFPAGRVP